MPHFEEHRWTADLAAFGGRKSRQSFVYRAFIPDRIGDVDFSLPVEVSAAMADAERAVIGLNTNPPAFGSLEAVARRLLRAESVASSRIEGLVMSQRRLAKAEFAGEDARDETALSIVGNIRAMEDALALGARAEPITVSALLHLHQRLLAGGPHNDFAGKLREEQNWIGGASSSPRDAEFVPPPHWYIRSLLEDLCVFLAREDLPATFQAAVAHAQFETIHPFADGNGRVGRALIHVVLRRRDLTPRFVPTVSLVLAGNSKAYVRGLTAFREGEVAEWVALFSAALRTAAHRAEQLAEEIRKLQEIWSAKAGSPRAHSAAAAIIDLLPAHPLMTVATAQELTSRSKQAANEGVAALERAGVLKQITVGKRNRAWEAQGLFDLVNSSEHALATSADSAKPVRPSPAASRASRFRERKGSTKK